MTGLEGLGRAKWPLFALFAISGGSGLAFEIVWIRALGLQFGTTTPAISTVLAAFMGGLALGSLYFGARADRHPRPLTLYRNIELGIAAAGLAVSLVLLHFDGFFGVLSTAIAAAGPLKVPLRFLLFGGLLLLPTTLMGGTLPTLSRALVRSGVSGRVVGLLYALNTAGAVVGVLLPDLLTIPALGLTATAGLATLGNLLVAALVQRVQVESPPVRPVAPLDADRVRVPRLPLAIYAASGFCAMGYELVWSRLMQHWSLGRITTFSVLLAVYLLSLAVGTAATSGLADRVSRPLHWAAALLASTAPLSLAVLLAPTELGQRFIAATESGHIGWLPGVGLKAVLLVGPSCLAMGAAFPFLAAAAVAEGSAGRSTGLLYAANALAGVAGSVAVGFFVLPHLGLQNSLFAVALLAVLAALLVLGWEHRRGRGGLALPAAVAALGLAIGAGAAALPAQHLVRVYYVDYPVLDRLVEGPTTSAASATRSLHGVPAFRELLTPAVRMSSTNFGARRYMGLMGHLPLLFSEERTDAALICYGVGNTARSLLSWPELERLDVIDISSEVLSLADVFAPEHDGVVPLEDPRVDVHIDDGRQHLRTHGQLYDVITLEPPPPANAGVVNLYTREFYREAKGALKPGGAVAQWLPVFQLTDEATEGIVGAFVAEFPHAALFYGFAEQWILVGKTTPLTIDLADWREAADRPPIREDLLKSGVDDVWDLLATFMLGRDALVALTEGVPPLADDRPYLQYTGEPSEFRTHIPLGGHADPAGVVDLVAGGAAAFSPEERARLEAATTTMRAVHASLGALKLEAPAAVEILAGPAIWAALAPRPDAEHVLALVGADAEWAGIAARGIEANGPAITARRDLARSAYYNRRWSDVVRLLDGPPDAQVNPAAWYLLRGGAERALGNLDAARADLALAAQAAEVPNVADYLNALLLQLDRPFPPEAGPLAVSK